MKRGLLILSIFLLLSSSALAFQAEYEPIQNEALPGESVSYILHINNNENEDQTVTIKSVDLNWILDNENFKFNMDAGEKRDVTVSFKPLGSLKPGRYGINLFVMTKNTKLEKVLASTVVDYSKALDVTFSSLPVLDPRKKTVALLNVRNNYNVLLNNIDLEVKGEHFELKQKLTLDKRESKDVELQVTMPSDSVEGNYKLKVRALVDDDKLLADKEFSYTVGSYDDLKQVVEQEGRFLISGEDVELNNEGNSRVSQVYTKDFDFFAYMFASFSPEPTKVKRANGAYTVEWSYVLGPKDSKTISYSVNYRIPTLIFIIIILIAAGVYVFRKKNAIVLTKRVLAMHGQEGSVHVMKVDLNIKNRGNMGVNNVRIVDRVPNSIKSPAQFGSASPSYIKPASDGTVMVWDIPHIGRGEEKIITYRLEGKHAVSSFAFPPAVAKYTSFGRAMAARSGIVNLNNKK